MAGKQLRNRNVTSVEDDLSSKNTSETDKISNIGNSEANHEVNTVEAGMLVNESNDAGDTVTEEVSVSTSTRQLQDLLTSAISTLTEQLDSKFQAATESITTEISARIQKENEKLHSEVRELANDIRTLRNDTENKFREITKTIEGISDAVNERVDAHVVATRKLTDKIYQEVRAGSERLAEELQGHKTETKGNLEEFTQKYNRFREQMKSELAAWQDKAGGEINEAHSSIQKVNAEIAQLREQLAVRQPAEGGSPNQVIPITDVEVESNNQPSTGLATNTGNYHVSKDDVNESAAPGYGNAKSLQRADSNVGSTIVSLPSDVFASNSPMNELSLPRFFDSSKQILLHFLRDLDEYYKIKNVPESLKLPLAMRAVTDPVARNWFSTVYGELKGYEHFKTLFTNFFWNSPAQARIRCSIYQDKFTRQDGETMTSHYLKYANLAANLQPAMSEEDLIGALTSHYPIAVQRSLISGNIKTTQDAINLLGKLDSLEDRDECRSPRRNPDRYDAGRRQQYNSRNDRAERNQGTSARVDYVQVAEGSHFDRRRADGSRRSYSPPTRRGRRGQNDSGWVERAERRQSHRTHEYSEYLNPAAQNFEPMTENPRSNVRDQGPPVHGSNEVLNN